MSELEDIRQRVQKNKKFFNVKNSCVKKALEEGKEALTEKPRLFSNREICRELRDYKIGKNREIDLALWNIYWTVEEEKDFEKDMRELEKAVIKNAKTEDQLLLEKIKETVTEEGAITLRDLMTKVGTRDYEKTRKLVMKAGMRLIDAEIFLKKIKRKPVLKQEIEFLLGKRHLSKIRDIAMSPEYCQRVKEKLRD